MARRPRKAEQKALTTANVWQALAGFGARTAAAISVTPSISMQCVPVYAGVRIRCETIGALPIKIFQRDGADKQVAKDHQLYALLHDRPNPWTSAADLVMQLEQDSITDGAGYAVANRSGDKIIELIRLAPSSVTVEYDEATLEPSYKVKLKNNATRVYHWSDVLHVPGFGGLSAIKQAREAIGLCLAMEKHAGLLFGNAGRPSGVLKTKGRLTDERYERLKKAWNSSYSGDAAGTTAILEDGSEFSPLTFNSVDLQFQELRAFQVIEIARALGVPPMLLMDFARATWSNSEQMAQAFLTFTVMPRLRVWQGAIERLMSPQDQAKFYAEFIVDSMVKADIAARFEAYSKAITSRILNPNEVRAKENLPPYAGGDEFANPNVTPAAPASAARPKPMAVAA